MQSRRTRTAFVAVGLLATSLALSACSTAAEVPSTEGLTIGAIDLSDVCPATVSTQTDWNPEAEHGHLYEMIGENPVIDADNKSVSGPLMAGGEYTGINLEVRSGGPAIGFQTVTAQLYTDPDITLGYANTDEQIQLSDQFPTTAVFAPLEKNPQMIMWDPATYPDVTTIAELAPKLAADGGAIKYFGGAAYMEYLIGSGIVPASVADGSYDGTPGNFVAQAGKDAQQGFASAEPYIYENEIEAWDKPISYELIHDAGYPIYAAAVSARTADVEKLTPCLEKLVPVMQQAEVDYFANSAATNTLILNLVDQFDTGWVYSQGVADYSVTAQIDEGLVGNGPDSTVGNFDPERMTQVFDIAKPIFEGLDTPPAAGLTAEDLYTNQFIDMSIGF
ncbi:MAG: ABC transporter substrate-binding protein [Burkholderiaceae bacterium]|nr:ABC transporter substrate-binding protein [Microbacteriaceae bacterium]